MKRFVCFGDSHSQSFENIMDTQYFPASSAKGLNNINSISRTNNAIKTTIDNENYTDVIFFFGKVDLDFIMNHMYEKYDNFDFELYIKKIVNSYINFIRSIATDTIHIYICELAISHMSDENLLLRMLDTHNHNSTVAFLDEKYSQLEYKKVLPFSKRNMYTLYFNLLLKNKCKLNGYTFLEINKYFVNDNTDEEEPYIVPKELIKSPTNHHLNDAIVKLYLKDIWDNEILNTNYKHLECCS